MSTTSNVTGTNALSDLAAQLFKSVDANSDGNLSNGEFQTFLEGLLNKVGTSPTTPAAAAAPVAKAVGAGTLAGYRAMAGFDLGKLNDSSHTTQKYVFARATQDIDLGSDRTSRSAGLPTIADYLKAHGFPDVTVIGDDKLNFGAGFADVDVLTSGGEWWWGPTA